MLGETPIYQRVEKSKVGYIFIIIGVALLVGFWLFPPDLPKSAEKAEFIIVVVSLFSIFIILLGYLHLRLYINGYFDRLVIQFGNFGPLRVSVQYSQIRSVERVKIPAIFRMQLGLKVDSKGWFFNTGTSAEAVKILYDNDKSITVVTTDPESLKGFIEQMIAQGIKLS